MSNKTIISAKVATTLSAQRIVAAAASAFTVCYPTAAAHMPIGITLDTVKDITQALPVQLNGPAYGYFNDTVAAGALVASDTSGRAVPFSLALTSTAISAPSAYVGVLWDAAVAATGAVAQILIHPGFDRKSA